MDASVLRPALAGTLLAKIRAVLAQRFFVEKVGLPSALLNQVKRLAAFQNPEFYRKQSLRLSTALTPRVIGCAEDLPQHIALPRGLRGELESPLGRHGVALEVEDKRESGTSVTYRFQGTLTDLQKKAVGALLAHGIGAFVAPPGVGKTIVGTYLVAERACSTLVLVHRQPCSTIGSPSSRSSSASTSTRLARSGRGNGLPRAASMSTASTQ